jgi:hypothetical protein
MTPTLALALLALFVCIAVTSGLAVARVLAWSAPERKRLRDLETPKTGLVREETSLTDAPVESLRTLSKLLPKSPKEMSRLRRQLAAAGHYELSAAVYYSAAKILAPITFGDSAASRVDGCWRALPP